MDELNCPICGRPTQCPSGLGVHISRAHPTANSQAQSTITTPSASFHDSPHDFGATGEVGDTSKDFSVLGALDSVEEWFAPLAAPSGPDASDDDSIVDEASDTPTPSDAEASESEDEVILAHINTASHPPAHLHGNSSSADPGHPLFPAGPPGSPPPPIKLGPTEPCMQHAQQPVHARTGLPVGKHVSPTITVPCPLSAEPFDPAGNNAQLKSNPFHPLNNSNSFLFAALCLLKADLSDSQSVDIENYVKARIEALFDPDTMIDLSQHSQTPLTLPTIRKKLRQSPFLLPVETDFIVDEESRQYAFVHADLLESLIHLVGRPHLAAYLQLVPEIHIQLGLNGPERVFGDVHTADAWSRVYVTIPGGGLALVYCLSSDKAQIFAKRAIWTLLLSTPMHLIDARAKPDLHAVFPLGFFIQADKVHGSVAQDAGVSSINKLVFHKCLASLFNTKYQNAARQGVRVRMPTGMVYQGFPRLLFYVADLPELALLTLTRQGQACPSCFTMSSSFMQRVNTLSPRSQDEMKTLVCNRDEATAGAKADVGQIMGIHLLYNGLWACPFADVYSSVVVDELHQILIGVFGRHLCGAILKEIDSTAGLRTRFYNRLRAVPEFSATPFRGLNTTSFANMTGAEWRSLCNVMPSVLVDLFDSSDKNDICVSTFAFIAEFVNLVCVPNVSETALAEASTSLDMFFKCLPCFLAAFNYSPDALTFHTLNHFLPAIPKFGSPRSTSTATLMEIHHKDNAKAPAKHTNKHGAVEVDALRCVLIQNALVDQYVFLLLFHPVQERLYSIASLQSLVQAIETSRPLIPLAQPRPPFAPRPAPMDNHAPNVPLHRFAFSRKLTTPLAAFRHKQHVPLHILESFHANLDGLQERVAKHLLNNGNSQHERNDAPLTEMQKIKALEQIKHVRTAQQLHIIRFSDLEQKDVSETICAYITCRHGKTPRDFCFVAMPTGHIGVFWPRLFLTYFHVEKSAHKLVAFGSWLKTHDDSSPERLPVHPASGLQVLYAPDKVDAIDVASILAPAHATPLFSVLEREGKVVSRQSVMACGMDRCKYFLLNSLANREVFQLLKFPDTWYRLS